MLNVIFGSGAIGDGFKNIIDGEVIQFSRDNIIYDDEYLFEAAKRINDIDRLIIAIGVLHNENIMPEKSLKDIDQDKMMEIFKVNTIYPSLILKHFLPKLNKDKSICAVLSARVGSISDNYLGGWYSYRASKSALNMIIKTSSIELARINKNSVIIGIHPGTVESELSRPFASNVKTLLNPEYSAKRMLEVIYDVSNIQSGSCYDYMGEIIEP